MPNPAPSTRTRCPAAIVVGFLALTLSACGSGGGGGGAPGDPSGGGDSGGGGSGGGGGGGNPVPHAEKALVLAAADEAVSPLEASYGVFWMRAPHAVVRAQVVRTDTGGAPVRLDGTQVVLTYEAVPDPSGAVNSASLSKTDFWTANPLRLLDLTVAPGQGLHGLFLPADAPTPGPQPFTWDAGAACFVADGIPLTATDDAGRALALPRLRLTAVDRTTGEVLGRTDLAVPVTSDTGCVACHTTGAAGATDPTVAWSAALDPERQARENVLRLHDARTWVRLADNPSIACTFCHHGRTSEITGTGMPPGDGWPTLSAALHGAHAAIVEDGPAGCARCHTLAHASRGAMAKGGMACTDCHGALEALAGAAPLRAGGSLDGSRDGAARLAWADLPRCESCHTGDALDRATGADLRLAADGVRLTQAFSTGDPAASPLRRDGTRFALPPSTHFDVARGHGGLLCSACHGGAHAEWGGAGAPAFDDDLPTRAQGHAGPLVECAACHAEGSLPMTLAGPHGMHPVADATWTVGGHGSLYRSDPDGCRACHGADLAGTVLSRAAADRSFDLPGRTVAIAKGAQVSCTQCHATHGSDLAWVDGGHGASYAQDASACASCHGADGKGTALSVAAADRTYVVGGSTYALPKGATVGCDDCHVPHATTTTWVASTHGPLYEGDHGRCTSCHGQDLAGTALSKTAASRTYRFGLASKTFAAGTSVACSACHVPHATTSSFFTSHPDAYERDPVACRLCHGHTLSGTSMSVTAATRTLTREGETYTIPAGTTVRCNLCHSKP